MPISKTVNKDFFKTWSHEMAYVLGFFAADGTMTKTKRGTYYFAIQVTDKEIVERIREVMNSNHTISVRKRTGNQSNLYRFQIGSKEIFEDITALGFSPNKSRRLLFPKIPKKYFGSFLRGYFDGDGNVWVGYVHKKRKTKTLAISTGFTSASKIFLLEIQKFLRDQQKCSGCFLSKNFGKYYILKYSVRDSLKIYKMMYNDRVLSSSLYLERKKKVFDSFLKKRL